MVISLVLLVLAVSLSFGESLYVAVSSSMRPPVEEIVRAFESEKGVSVKVSYGSSGSLYKQIVGGAPYQVFLSANEDYPRRLAEKGLTDKDTIRVFANGRLVVFSLERIESVSSALLKANRIAIANPRYAPYGKAGLEFLKTAGIYEKVRGRVVYGSNVGQAFQFVVSGGADVGIVSLSLAKVYGKGYYLDLPEGSYPAIKHVVAITSEGKENELAKMFLDFLTSEKAKMILKKYGFGLP